MPTKKAPVAAHQIGMKLTPAEHRSAMRVAAGLGLNLQSTIRFLLKQAADYQAKGTP
jgi:antitoxin component of RelBE/YafQ-DinJ toxin-antitoxin module